MKNLRSGARGPPHFLKKRSENAGANENLSAPKSQRFLRFLRLRCPSRTPEIAAISETRESNADCDLRLRWKVASDLRFQAAISEPKTPSFCGISGDLAPSTRKSLAIAIVRFWCAKMKIFRVGSRQFRESLRELLRELWVSY